MMSPASWQALISAAVDDRDSGSWAVTRKAAAGLAAAGAEGEPALREAIRRLLEGQPCMAALRNLANAAARAAEAGDTAVAVPAFLDRGEASLRATAAQATALLAEHQARRAVTISASGAVELALAGWRGPALIFESRPRNEGRALASRLAAAGLPVTLAVDAAARASLTPGDVVLLGADGVTPEGLRNKIGSWALAAAAHDRHLPVYVLAGPEKWWPEPLPDTGRHAARDPREVICQPIPGVQVDNPTFELVPFSLLTDILTPDGPRRWREVRAALSRWRIHPWLHALAPAGSRGRVRLHAGPARPSPSTPRGPSR
jgi:translation initiation factor 2B subunit (eIF-2B alpha/beta/delta family)